MSSPLNCLVTGASGYIGGRLVPELLSAGYAVRCMARDPGKLSDRPWSDDVEIAAADVHGRRRGAARPGGRGRRLLPDPLPRHGRVVRTARPRRGADVRRGREGRRRAAHRLPGRPHLRAGREAVPAPALPRGGRRHPAGQRRADGRAAGRGDHRLRIGVVRDAALPHRAAAGHGHPALGATPASSRSPSATCCATWSAAPRCRPRSTAASTSAAPTCSPTRR